MLSFRRSHRGFTLIEMMIVIAVAGILCVFAIPSIRRIVDRTRIKTAAVSIKRQIQTAQTMALRNNQLRCGIYFKCVANSQSSQIFIDNNSDGKYNPTSDTKVLEQAKLPLKVSYFIPSSGGIVDSVFIFRGNRSAVKFGTIGLCNDQKDTILIKVIASTGRARIIKTH
jgi:prepilin-type N-terminal cleavage/methylation domain-containing protein